IFISGFLVTGSFNAVILQAVQLAMDMGIYYPFMRMQDIKYLEDEKNSDNKKDDLDDLSFDDLQLN
ncbi:MAG: PTS sugar transporter subunit IIC, partial [Erysipelotrichaceae bacterium]|nr:PTS sugar transporter subunit IIC [Erysipelotrichaceae bacterium]